MEGTRPIQSELSEGAAGEVENKTRSSVKRSRGRLERQTTSETSQKEGHNNANPTTKPPKKVTTKTTGLMAAAATNWPDNNQMKRTEKKNEPVGHTSTCAVEQRASRQWNIK